MSIDCPHWRDCGIKGGGCCAVGKYNRPSFGVCLHVCLGKPPPVRRSTPPVDLDAMGYDVETAQQEAKGCGCCDPPKA